MWQETNKKNHDFSGNLTPGAMLEFSTFVWIKMVNAMTIGLMLWRPLNIALWSARPHRGALLGKLVNMVR